MLYLKYFIFSLFFLTTADNISLKRIFSFPKKLKEVSGIEADAKSKLIWALQDSGNPAELYALDSNGKIQRTVAITNAVNNDWEEMTSDVLGNLYIGDFGNNKNDRKDLTILKVDATSLKSTRAAATQKTTFFYPEQTDFPPKKSKRVYDLESFFISGNNFYLFTKDRTDKGETTLYSVPNKPGKFAAKLIARYKTCENFHFCAVTSADMSPDGKTVAILSSMHVWLFTNFKGDNFFSGKVRQLNLRDDTQKEGLCFTDNNTLLICDERNSTSGGNVYELGF